MTKPKSASAEPKAPAQDKYNPAKMRAARFEGFSRAHLNKAHEMYVGFIPEAGLPDEDVIESLCRACNVPQRQPGGPQVPPSEVMPASKTAKAAIQAQTPQIARIGRIPNLSPIGAWEGRKRRVQFGPTGTAAETITLGWDAQARWAIRVPDIVDLPWPYWCIVRDAVSVDTLSKKARKWVRNEETEQLETIIKKDKKTGLLGIRRPVYNYVDQGDVPGTETLPTGYFEFFQEEAKKTGMFAKFGRQSLMMIHGKLRDGTPSTFYEKRDSVDIRFRIAEVLGPFAVDLMNEEVYAAESDASQRA